MWSKRYNEIPIIIRFNEQMNTYAVEKLKALSKFIKKILISFGYFNFIYS